MMKKSILTIIIICLSAGHIFAQEKPLKKLSLALIWVPQAQFAGYYVACEKGIYQSHGIDLTIFSGGPEVSSEEMLERGEADIAVLWLSQAIDVRSRGVEIVNLCQVMKKSSLMFIARAEENINSPEDLMEKKVSIWDGALGAQARAFLRKYNIKTTVIPQSCTVNLFLAGGVNVVSAMEYNEYHTIINSGLDPAELTVLPFYEYGLDIPEDGLYSLAVTYEKDPELLREFAEASMAGWVYAFEHPQETVDIILEQMRKARVPANRMHQEWMLAALEKKIFPEGRTTKCGLSREKYRITAELLIEEGMIENAPEFESFFVCGDNQYDE